MVLLLDLLEHDLRGGQTYRADRRVYPAPDLLSVGGQMTTWADEFQQLQFALQLAWNNRDDAGIREALTALTLFMASWHKAGQPDQDEEMS